MSYKIVRFFRQDEKPHKVIEAGLTLEEAKKHCNQPRTKGNGWFEGYTEE
jgi:hypothetical protein